MAEPPAKRQNRQGGEETAFTLYTDIATHSSKFFQAALSIDSTESQQNSVTLTGVSPVEFDYYLQWLSTHDRSFLSDINSSQLAKLYILGDVLGDSAFRNCILNHFVQHAIDKSVYPHHTIVTSTWKQTPEDSPLRKMMVEIWITASIKELATRFAGVHKDVPKEFVIECLHRIGDTHARATESMSPEERERTLERRRDEVLKELVA